jgi:hypothetical protein
MFFAKNLNKFANLKHYFFQKMVAYLMVFIKV